MAGAHSLELSAFRSPKRIRTRLRARRLDIALGAIGVFLGALSLCYPFGHDQGVHYYVAREWTLHGAIPYRDTFDYKTPGIFVVHGLVIRLFGERLWGIRIAEIACVAALATMCARLTTAHRQRGFAGFMWLVTFAIYYGYFSFWDTAQCEIWAAALAIGSVVAVRRSRPIPMLAGVLAGMCFLMKPPAILLAIPAIVHCRHSLRSLALFLLGCAAPIVATVGYFAAHHAIGALVEVLIGANTQYVIGLRRVDSPGELFEQAVDVLMWFHPFGALLVGGAIVTAFVAYAAGRRVGWPRLEVAFAVLGFLAIAVQLKFYRYHFALLVPALVMAIGHVQSRILVGRVGLGAVVVALLYAISGTPSREWLANQRALATYVRDLGAREAFASRFVIPSLAYNERDSEDVARWLDAHTRESDVVLVRDFQAEIYALARRRAVGRFFWTIPLTDPKRQYKRTEWLDEDARVVATLPPVVVTRSDATGPDAVSRFTALGYTRCHASGRLLVLARMPNVSCDL